MRINIRYAVHFLISIVALSIALCSSVSAVPSPYSGAIFTTMSDGSAVNENVHYRTKNDVYINGGPLEGTAGPGGLPEGYYVFQVTDPGGMVLLSKDPSKCRIVEIDTRGVFSRLVLPGDLTPPLTNEYQPVFGPHDPASCHSGDPGKGRHATSVSQNGGIVVQLMPYLFTPNSGGIYKVWLTPLNDYLSRDGNLNELPKDRGEVPGAGYKPDPGFPKLSAKTDNFKVYEGKTPSLCKNVENIINSFDNRNPSSFNAVEDLVGLGPGAVPCLLYAVQYGDTYSKWAGIYALSRIGYFLDETGKSEIVQVLKPEINNTALSIRLMAASVITILGDRDGIPVLIDLLKEDGFLINSEPPKRICLHAYETLQYYLPVIYGQSCENGTIDMEGYHNLLQWWNDNKDGLAWNPDKMRYELP